jgi:multidrug efflux pump subunit AcrB
MRPVAVRNCRLRAGGARAGRGDQRAELSQTQIALPAAHVRLGEVATVTDGNSEQRSISKMGGARS